ncbi:glycosyltransferase family 4 protein [Myxacorys almedinensis]|uniref:Glycosyltransferase n=1 Tax=Myxacorys almedinensis A TaxID=2690445 RepID=A0A8J7Z063_9CYAN|nr:glycosyltransferase family 4 protein [Myxacorys almedinensis]NDJ16630.1 glycosyltransferase [Myxacorys almedinensis A]
MKTLFTCQYPFDLNSGAAGVTWRLGREFEQLGHDVEYYFINDLPKVHPLVKFASFPAFVGCHLSQRLRQDAIDVIDTCTGDAWLWATALQRFQPHRPLLVVRSHGLEHTQHLDELEEAQRGNLTLGWKYFMYRGSLRLWEAATSMRHADLVLLLNQRDRSYAIEQLGIHPDRAHIVANGISAAMLNLPFEPTPAAGEPVRIAQVSSYIFRKGIQYGTPILNAILRRYPQVEVSLLGTERPADEVYADFAPEVRDRVKVVPYYVNDTLPTLLKGHHIKLFPTVSEGFGVALIEAMACGLAPVTTDAAGPLEIVQEGYDALVVPRRDRAALERALDTLICDRALLDQVRRRAYKSAQRFSWSRIAQDNLHYYEKAEFNRLPR